ncbi:MAG TPA: bifunctional oligoribonuclease/PAP phosphatase NrnA [Opitutaceae bacterium]|nr:bifunctional oligoribonuclease/PAP phosphatase NrnA [Opitutaceae bacterium]
MSVQAASSGAFSPKLSGTFAAMLPALQGQTIAVVGHARPDGDCIGSQVGLARILQALGHTVVCANADPVPRLLQFLTVGIPFLKADEVPPEAVAIFVDCADHARPGEKMKARFPRPFANIDHHLSNHGYAEHNFLDTSASATCEILASLAFDNSLPIDPVAAQALYTGIVTDTGQFRFSSTSRNTFLLAAALVAKGAQPSAVGLELYERESPGKLKLLQRFLASLQMECGGRVCLGLLPLGIFAETGTQAEDTEGLVDYARSIDGVEVGVLIEEREGGIKASLRGKDPAYRLDQIAARFNGGGHACAAGLNLKGVTTEIFRARLIAALSDQITAVNLAKAKN